MIGHLEHWVFHPQSQFSGLRCGFLLSNFNRQQPVGQPVSTATPNFLLSRPRRISEIDHRNLTSRLIDRIATPDPSPFFATDKNNRKHGYRVDRPVGACFPEAASHFSCHQEQDQASWQGWRECSPHGQNVATNTESQQLTS